MLHHEKRLPKSAIPFLRQSNVIVLAPGLTLPKSTKILHVEFEVNTCKIKSSSTVLRI